MAESVRKYYTLDRDPDSDEWNDCPAGDHNIRSRGRDPHVDEYDIYEYFVCDDEDCRVKEVVVRSR